MKKVLIIATAFLFITANIFAQGNKPKRDKVLGGKTYVLESTEQNVKSKKGPKAFPDELSFKQEKMWSKAMAESNFEPSPYNFTIDSTDTANKIISFDCEMKNEYKEKLTWEGTIKGFEIEGTFTWIDKKGKTKAEYAFTGMQKGKKKKVTQ